MHRIDKEEQRNSFRLKIIQWKLLEILKKEMMEKSTAVKKCDSAAGCSPVINSIFSRQHSCWLLTQ